MKEQILAVQRMQDYGWDDSNPRIQLEPRGNPWVHRAQSGQTEIRMSRAVPKMYRP